VVEKSDVSNDLTNEKIATGIATTKKKKPESHTLPERVSASRGRYSVRPIV
jgi:hypothetical protein